MSPRTAPQAPSKSYVAALAIGVVFIVCALIGMGVMLYFYIRAPASEGPHIEAQQHQAPTPKAPEVAEVPSDVAVAAAAVVDDDHVPERSSRTLTVRIFLDSAVSASERRESTTRMSRVSDSDVADQPLDVAARGSLDSQSTLEVPPTPQELRFFERE